MIKQTQGNKFKEFYLKYYIAEISNRITTLTLR